MLLRLKRARPITPVYEEQDEDCRRGQRNCNRDPIDPLPFDPQVPSTAAVSVQDLNRQDRVRPHEPTRPTKEQPSGGYVNDNEEYVPPCRIRRLVFNTRDRRARHRRRVKRRSRNRKESTGAKFNRTRSVGHPLVQRRLLSVDPR